MLANKFTSTFTVSVAFIAISIITIIDFEIFLILGVHNVSLLTKEVASFFT